MCWLSPAGRAKYREHGKKNTESMENMDLLLYWTYRRWMGAGDRDNGIKRSKTLEGAHSSGVVN